MIHNIAIAELLMKYLCKNKVRHSSIIVNYLLLQGAVHTCMPKYMSRTHSPPTSLFVHGTLHSSTAE